MLIMIVSFITGFIVLGVCISMLRLKAQNKIEGSIEGLSAPLIVFDFDGVICDSFGSLLLAFNHIAPKYGLSPINLDSTEQYRQLDSKALIQSLGISVFQLKKMIPELRRELGLIIEDIPVFDESLALIQTLHQEGYSLGIVTTNSIGNVKRYLNKYDVNCFNFIISTGTFAKKNAFKKIISKSKIPPHKIYFIGDESRDIEAGKSHKIRTVAATWGYQSAEVLSQFNPEILLASPGEMLLHLKLDK